LQPLCHGISATETQSAHPAPLPGRVLRSPPAPCRREPFDALRIVRFARLVIFRTRAGAEYGDCMSGAATPGLSGRTAPIARLRTSSNVLLGARARPRRAGGQAHGNYTRAV